MSRCNSVFSFLLLSILFLHLFFCYSLFWSFIIQGFSLLTLKKYLNMSFLLMIDNTQKEIITLKGAHHKGNSHTPPFVIPTFLSLSLTNVNTMIFLTSFQVYSKLNVLVDVVVLSTLNVLNMWQRSISFKKFIWRWAKNGLQMLTRVCLLGMIEGQCKGSWWPKSF